MDELIRKKNKNRFNILLNLYERTNGDKYACEIMWDIGDKLGLSREDTQNAINYLMEEGLATDRGIGGFVAMTHAGVLEVERALLKPEIATEHFPPIVNIVNVHNMNGSQIQQGTHSSTQSQTISENDLEVVRSLLVNLKPQIASLPLKDEERDEANAEIQRLEVQLRSGV